MSTSWHAISMAGLICNISIGDGSLITSTLKSTSQLMPCEEYNCGLLFCYNQMRPITTEGYWGSGSDLPTMRMADNVINITRLSEYRKDGHPCIYRKFWKTLSPQQLANPASYSDCIHWCLPGVPDVWNELIFHSL
ncbi:hypothetical protein V6N13_041279 [Hibiscus sabdariffa]